MSQIVQVDAEIKALDAGDDEPDALPPSAWQLGLAAWRKRRELKRAQADLASVRMDAVDVAEIGQLQLRISTLTQELQDLEAKRPVEDIEALQEKLGTAEREAETLTRELAQLSPDTPLDDRGTTVLRLRVAEGNCREISARLKPLLRRKVLREFHADLLVRLVLLVLLPFHATAAGLACADLSEPGSLFMLAWSGATLFIILVAYVSMCARPSSHIRLVMYDTVLVLSYAFSVTFSGCVLAFGFAFGQTLAVFWVLQRLCTHVFWTHVARLNKWTSDTRICGRLSSFGLFAFASWRTNPILAWPMASTIVGLGAREDITALRCWMVVWGLAGFLANYLVCDCIPLLLFSRVTVAQANSLFFSAACVLLSGAVGGVILGILEFDQTPELAIASSLFGLGYALQFGVYLTRSQVEGTPLWPL